MAALKAVTEPDWRLLWNAKDVTADLKGATLSIRYSDELEDASDELEVVLEDRDGLWRGPWLPIRGDSAALALGYAGRALASMGSFEIDEVTFDGPPDTVTLRCLAAQVTASWRTGADVAYEGRTLGEIAAAIAAKNGLSLVGAGENLGRFYERVTQHRERDLAFLNRLGAAEGIVFAVKDRRMVWHDQPQLDALPPVATIERTAVSRYNLKLVASVVYRACRVSYHDPATKTLISAECEAPGVPSGDTLTLVRRCETREQAEAKAAAELRKANGRQFDGSITLPGDPALRAGVNVLLKGFGRLDVKTQIIRAEHTLSRGEGYVTTITLGAPTEQEVVA